MRRLVQQVLEGVDPLVFPAGKILQASSVDSGLVQIPELPFIIHRFSLSARTPSNRGRPSLDVWVYDAPGSYQLIDETLRKVRAAFLAIADMRTEDGLEHIATVDWVNDSSDLPAEEYSGITRMAAFVLVGSTA